MSTGEAAAGPDDVSVVVLAGGTSRRFGSDKLAAPLGGSTVLDTVLASLPPGLEVVAVGPAKGTRRPVTWTREDPPGGGPLAGVAAGMALVRTTLVAVVAGDMPYAGTAVPALVAALRAASTDVVGVVARDEDGVPNPLLAAYHTDAVRELLPTPADGRPAKLLLALPHLKLTVTGSAARDVDTPADLDELGGHR